MLGFIQGFIGLLFRNSKLASYGFEVQGICEGGSVANEVGFIGHDQDMW